MAGIKYRLDVFGVLVLSFAAANSGGIIRDLLIGAVPPPGISDWRYITVPVLAGIAMFHWGPVIRRVERAVQLFDAAGLALFAVSGAQKALDFHLGPVASVLLGMLTGIGGGIVRDVLTAQIPSVLSGDIYAVAALAGASVVVVSSVMHLHSVPGTLIGAVLCFGLRYLALRRGWQLPEARWSNRSGADPDSSVKS
jgi:uncharacterized membrane protein YeiH